MRETLYTDNNIIVLKNNIKILVDSHEVFKENDMTKLKPKEYDLLLLLAETRNKVFIRRDVIFKVNTETEKVEPVMTLPYTDYCKFAKISNNYEFSSIYKKVE